MDRNDNLQVVVVSVLKGAQLLSRRAAFKRGYDAAIKNMPYDYNIESKHDAINYARGRAFAVWSRTNREPGCRWKNGVLSRAAEERLVRAIYVRAVI